MKNMCKQTSLWKCVIDQTFHHYESAIKCIDMVLTYVLELFLYACPTGYKDVYKIDREWYMNSYNCVANFFRDLIGGHNMIIKMWIHNTKVYTCSLYLPVFIFCSTMMRACVWWYIKILCVWSWMLLVQVSGVLWE